MSDEKDDGKPSGAFVTQPDGTSQQLTAGDARALLGFVPDDHVTKPVKVNHYVEVGPRSIEHLNIPAETFHFDGFDFAAGARFVAHWIYLASKARRGDREARLLLDASGTTVTAADGRSYWPPEEEG